MEHRIGIWGDSITWGAVDREGGWADRLKRFFLEKYDDMEVYNLGISGDTSTGVKARFEVECSARETGIVVFAIGINDAMSVGGIQKTNLTTFETNYRWLVEQAQARKSKVVCVGLLRVDESKTVPVRWNSTISYHNEDIEKYDAIIRKVAKEQEVPYVLLEDLFTPEDFFDGLHPNDQGHQALFKRMKDVMESLL